MKIYILSFIILVSCATSNQTRVSNTENLNQFFEKAFNEEVGLSPESQTYLGFKKDDHLLDDISENMVRRSLELSMKHLNELKKFNFDELTKEGKLNYRIFEEQLQDSIAGFKYRYHSYPVNQMFGRHSSLPSFMINMHQIENLEDAKDYISRINQFRTNFDSLIENLTIREQKGIIAPKFVYPKVIKESQNIITGFPFKGRGKSPLYGDFESKVQSLKLNKAKENELLMEMKEAMSHSVGPAYSNLILKLIELEKIAPVEAPASSLPHGEEFYAYLLKELTTTDMSAEEIHNFGLSETKRIHVEMNLVLKQLNFKGNLQDFFKFMRTYSKFKYPNTLAGKKNYLEDTNKIVENMKASLPIMFNRLPKANLIVKAVEPYREASSPQAFYEGPSENGKRPGIYYVNLHDMTIVSKSEQEALAYHEALPGHHLQIAIAKELDTLPSFRRHGGYTAFSEGWGLYAEYFPKEFGFYKNPYSEFGRLTMELWRAGRLVVDTGLHHKKWSMEKAVQWLDANTHKPHSENVSDVQRYVVIPGQATTYKVGMQKFLELRELAKAKLGDKFDIKAFHDQVLGHGALPLNILEEKVLEWIDQQK